MIFSKLIVLAGLLVSSTIASPVAAPNKDREDFLTVRDVKTDEYWGRGLSSRDANCAKTAEGGATLCSYTNAEVEAYNAAHPDHSQSLAQGCFKTATHTHCLLAAAAAVAPPATK